MHHNCKTCIHGITGNCSTQRDVGACESWYNPESDIQGKSYSEKPSKKAKLLDGMLLFDRKQGKTDVVPVRKDIETGTIVVLETPEYRYRDHHDTKNEHYRRKRRNRLS